MLLLSGSLSSNQCGVDFLIGSVSSLSLDVEAASVPGCTSERGSDALSDADESESLSSSQCFFLVEPFFRGSGASSARDESRATNKAGLVARLATLLLVLMGDIASGPS